MRPWWGCKAGLSWWIRGWQAWFRNCGHNSNDWLRRKERASQALAGNMFEFELRLVTSVSCEAGQVIQDSGKLSPVRADPQNAKAHAVTSRQDSTASALNSDALLRRLLEVYLTLSWALPA